MAVSHIFDDNLGHIFDDKFSKFSTAAIIIDTKHFHKDLEGTKWVEFDRKTYDLIYEYPT